MVDVKRNQVRLYISHISSVIRNLKGSVNIPPGGLDIPSEIP